MDPDLFSTPLGYGHTDVLRIVRDCLLHGHDSERELKIELCKLNFHGKGSSFKPHVDSPRGEKMFGSLVLVFPTPHEGGTLLIRHGGKEWTIDSAAELSTAPPSSIGYAAFTNDVEYEVAPVVSGHRITLTYNLHFDDDGRAPVMTSVSEPAPPLPPAMERSICAAFEALLENPEFLPEGGVLGFGLQHVYQFKDHLKHVYALYRAVRSLGFEPALYLYYEYDDDAALIDHVPDFEGCEDVWDMVNSVRRQGAITVLHEGDDVTPVDWVTPVTTFNCLSSTYLAYGNQATLELAYGNLCLIVQIGEAGGRTQYTTLEKEWEDEGERWPDYASGHLLGA
ncbi:hypothetical protein BC826DRAFT_1179272 [Russula brevipes]|nr:hypothetical protein BC826DRAFT_1179272 [Russula brevipes]